MERGREQTLRRQMRWETCKTEAHESAWTWAIDGAITANWMGRGVHVESETLPSVTSPHPAVPSRQAAQAKYTDRDFRFLPARWLLEAGGRV